MDVMGRGMICLLVLGLANLLLASELGLENIQESEIKEIEAEIAKGNTPPDYQTSDKTKRGVSKVNGVGDGSTYNQITATSGAGAQSQVKGSSTVAGQIPYRYLYNNQYYQTSPYVSYVQAPQTGYSFQPITHYLQTPTQIQYVSTPARYQTINAKSATTQYVPPTQQVYLAPQSVYSTSQASTGTTTSTGSSHYSIPQQLYYHQQPIVMLLVQPQPQAAQAVIYPTATTTTGQQNGHQISYVLGQQPLFYGSHRFALPYTATPQSQVTYLVPMAVQTTSAQQVAAAAKAAAEKSSASIQTATTGSYGLRTTKA